MLCSGNGGRMDYDFIFFKSDKCTDVPIFFCTGFLSHPPSGYPSYLTPPAPAPAPPAPPDPRASSIAALRMKAKEHVESLSKGLQMV